MSLPIRFLHTADLMLGGPLFAVANLPPDCQARLKSARYVAAERVFDLAIREAVDFVLLAGGALSETESTPAAVRFLASQFARLAEHDIPLFWAESTPRLWRDYIALPENVDLIDSDFDLAFDVMRGETTIAQVTGGGRAIDEHDPEAIHVAVLPDGLEDLPLTSTDINYWALGGRAWPGAIPSVNGVAQFSGPPQGRSPNDAGLRGCMLVEVDARRTVTSRFESTAAVQWHDVTLTIDEGADWESLRRDMRTRMQELARSAAGNLAIVRWAMTGCGPLLARLSRPDVTEPLLADLRAQFSLQTQPVWSLLINVSEATQEDAADSELVEMLQAPRSWHDDHQIAAPHFEELLNGSLRRGAPADRQAL